jgi:methyl-accepting chemotaxis protein
MAGFGKKLAGFFFEEEEEVQDQAQEATEEKASEEPAEAAPVAPAPVVKTATPEGEEDQKIAERLAQAVADNDIEGFDYFEFAQLLASLKPSMPSEQTLFQTAFTSGKVMGADKDKLLSSADHYLKVLAAEKAKFLEMVESQTSQTVTGLEESVADIDEQVAQAGEQIRQLTERINQLTEKKTEVTNQVAENKAKIEKVQNNFEITFAKYVARIQGDIEKIGKYIKEEPANA